MIINGYLKTENKVSLQFKFTTFRLNKTLGNKTSWTDSTFNTSSILKINGKPIGTDYYNYVLTDEFKRMYKNSEIDFNEYLIVELSNTDLEIIGNTAKSYINSDPDLLEFNRNIFIDFDEINPVELGKEYKDVIDEYFTYSNDFHQVLNDSFELSNNYHCLSQWNNCLDYICEYIDNEYENYLIDQEIA